MTATTSRVLGAPLKVAFDYTRSTGPVLGAFFTGLRDGRVLAQARTSDGRVVVPPVEYDPVTHAADRPTSSRSPPSGTVTTWTWVSEPVPGQPLDRPVRVRPGPPRRRRRADAARGRGVRPRRDRAPACACGSAGPTSRGGRITDIALLRAGRRRGGLETRRSAAPRHSTTERPGHRDHQPSRARLPLRGLPRGVGVLPRPRRGHGSSASAARPATRSTCRRAAPARSTACRRPTRSSSPTRAS